ncbi:MULTISPECIES: recombinase family protein [Corynebacterium]|uniref:Recombinase n=1 Tax=Corynebacterium ihumii TaxID=1232427 RepID=A0ABY7UI21_9CORY|nr:MULTISPECIES: recombinase family protein [Corynebacterium]WCZ35102.1 Recombinase [Corynebacterium ihumii]
MRIYDPKTGQRTDIVEEPQQAAIVREIFTRVADAEPINAIAKDFNIRGIPTRRPVINPEREGQGWISQSIKQVVTNKSYIGIRVHKGAESPAQWPALVDQELFDAANAILADPRRDTRKAKADFEAKHLLSGIARCAICGAKMGTAKQNAGRKRVDKDTGEVLPRQTYRSYLCQGLGPASTGPRFHVSMKEVSLDTLVEAAVIARLSRPDFLATLDEGGEDDVADRRAAIHTEIEKLESYLEAVRQRAAQELDMNLLFDQERRIKPKLERLQAELTSLVEIDPLVVELAAENDVAARWEALPLETKRQVIRELMDVRVAKPTLPKGSTALDMGRVQITWLH